MTRTCEGIVAMRRRLATAVVRVACLVAMFAGARAGAQVAAAAPSIDAVRAAATGMLVASRQVPATSQPRAVAVRPFIAATVSAQRLRDSLVSLARAQVGRRYRIGGQSPSEGFDCSGLVRFVLAAVDVPLPRTAREQSMRGSAVAREAAQLIPGDLLTFGRGQRVTHIGVYVGDGRFVHASSVAGRVVESAIDRAPAPRIKPWSGARRVIADAP